jgi:hypothetical protein
VNNTQPTKHYNTENKITFFVFCVVMFGWLSVAHLFSFLCCDFSTNQTLQHRKQKRWATLNQSNITTQKTKKVNNTQPIKHYNTENEKGEQHSTIQKSQHRKLKRWATLNQTKITTQKTKKVSNTQPTKNYNTEN